MKAKRVLPVVPDAALWANKYRQVIFDELPEHEPARNDLLFRTQPTPRATCFGFFSPAEDSGDLSAYKLQQNYVWENRSGFTRMSSVGEGESVLLSFPGSNNSAGEVRFVPVPARVKLIKQKAQQ